MLERPPLHVGYVLKKYPRLSETFILNELLGLEQAGVQVSVFSLRLPDDGRFHGDLARLRAEVRYLPGFGGASVVDALGIVGELGQAAVDSLPRALAFLERLSPANAPLVLVQALHLAGWVKESGIDHLQAHFMTVAAHTTYLAHLLTGVPFSVTAHAKDIFRHTVDIGVLREVAAAASSVITVCEANRRFMEDALLHDQGRVERVYNGVDLDTLSPPSAGREEGLVLAAGRLVEKKGFSVLLDAARLIADRELPCRVLIIGEGDERANLEEQRRRLGLEDRVTLAGAVPRDQIMEWMGRARVLAAPCLVAADGNRDALPTVLVEALALGLPVVSTTLGGVPEIVDDGVQGLLVAPRDPVALARAVERLLADDVMWRRMSAAGRPKVEARFDRRRTLPQLIEVFERPGPRSRPLQLLTGLR